MRNFALLSLTLIAASAVADTISFGGQKHDGVLVRESSSMYYVQDPATGEVQSIKKTDASAFARSVDAAETSRLRETWQAAHNKAHPDAKPIEVPASSAPAASSERESDAPTPRLAARGGLNVLTDGGKSDGRVPYLKLTNVPLHTALDAALRPLNLDYKVEDGYIFISTPDRLEHESFDPMETQTYNDVVEDTLPKVVLRVPAGFSGGISSGFGNSGSFGGNSGQNSVGGNFGSGSFGGNGSNGGFGGDQGFGAGNGGGVGGQGNFRDVTSISNISDLFSTIDDRLVGESPAQIAVGYQFTGSR